MPWNWNSWFGGADDVEATDIDSGSATDGQVLTSDGAGNAAWEDAAGGGADPQDGTLVFAVQAYLGGW